MYQLIAIFHILTQGNSISIAEKMSRIYENSYQWLILFRSKIAFF